MSKFIELGAEEKIKTSEIFGKAQKDLNEIKKTFDVRKNVQLEEKKEKMTYGSD